MSSKERQRMIYRLIRGDAEDEDEPKKKKGGGHGNNRLPYGLCEEFGIDLPAGTSPRAAWEALKGEGITPDEAYGSLKKYKNISNYKHKVRQEHYRGTKPTTNSQHSSTHYRPKGATEDTPITDKELEHKAKLAIPHSASAASRISTAYNGSIRRLKEFDKMLSKGVLSYPQWGDESNADYIAAGKTLQQLIDNETDELDKKRLSKMLKPLKDIDADSDFYRHNYNSMASCFKKIGGASTATDKDIEEVGNKVRDLKGVLELGSHPQDLKQYKERHPEAGERLEKVIQAADKVGEATKHGAEATRKAQAEFNALLNGERAIVKVEDVKSKSGIDAKYPEITKTLTDVDNTFRELKKDPNAHSYGDTAYLMQNVHTTLKRALGDTTRARLKSQDEEEKKQLAAREKDITEKMATADVTGMYYRQKHMQDRLDSLKKKGVSSSVLEDEKGEYENFLNKSLNKIDTTYKRGQMSEEGRKFMREKVRPALVKALWGEEDKL
ncbi:MAG: hypothetical protein LUD47_07680 [Clostridia bacterium]|nr:hypothetical protein [Clostridia bacterium]